MSRKAAGKRIFSFSDLGHEKATTTRSLLSELSHMLSGLGSASYIRFIFFAHFLLFPPLIFSPPYTLIVGLADLPRLLFLFVHPVCAVC